MKKFKTKSNEKIRTSGITLIAVIVTIIVLLILAGISIAMIRNSNLLDKTKIAKGKYSNSQKEETATIDDYSNQIENYKVAENGRDTVTISKEEYEELKNANSYSKEETKIGTWIDGKPIYRKVVPVVITGTTAHNIDNLDTLVNYDLMWYDDTDNVWYNRFRLWEQSYGVGLEININSNDINIGSNKYNSIDWTKRTSRGFAILEYTKTTDAATKN